MKKNTLIFILSAAGLVLAAGLIILAAARIGSQPAPQDTAFTMTFGADVVRAEVRAILEEGEITLGDVTQPYQVLLLRIAEGPLEGQLVEIDYGKRQLLPSPIQIQKGDILLINANAMPNGQVNAYFVDFVRTRPLLILLGTFVIFSILISGWKAVRSMIGLAGSMLVITGYILPQILAGRDPVLVSITGAFFLLAFTIYITYGWTLKSHAAVAGTLLALILTGVLAAYFIELTRLTGFGNEDALFLVQTSEIRLNLRGLVLGGMLIGALGVLDDLVITQSSAVFEIAHAARDQGARPGFQALFRTAMRIGRDHVAATVNTLVLAYAGAALPSLLLLSLNGAQAGYLVNFEFLTEEIVRTLVGSLGLMSAVPLSTLIASLLAVYHDQLGPLARWLGPEGAGHSH